MYSITWWAQQSEKYLVLLRKTVIYQVATVAIPYNHHYR